MIAAFSFISALFVTMVLLPPLLRAAGPLHLLDIPNDRKVHTESIPRCGGLAIACGITIPIVMWVPKDGPILGILSGSIITFLFGLWDDVKDIDYRIKLLGQAIALLIAMHAGVVLLHYPFAGLDPVPLWVAYPATALIVLGITNAINLTDGLDGLAAGCTLITLGMIAFISYDSDNLPALLLSVTLTGGILGFLRYNTHPAVVFLGDAGSQFLGFITAALTIFLVEQVNSALSPALPLLLLGLPILDMLWVVCLRIAAKQSPFRADRRHLHHQLLDLGFRHHEAVALLYLLHAGLVSAAFYLRYASDVLIISIYLGFCFCVVSLIGLAKKQGWKRHSPELRNTNPAEARRSWLSGLKWLPAAITYILGFLISGFLLVTAAIVGQPPQDLAIISAASALGLIIGVFLLPGRQRWLSRAGVYMASVLIVFQLAQLPTGHFINEIAVNTFLVTAALILALGIRTAKRHSFAVSPQDLLIVFFALVVPNLTSKYTSSLPIAEMLFRLLILFYVTEFLLSAYNRGHYDGQLAQRIERNINGLLRYSAILSMLILVFKRPLL